MFRRDDQFPDLLRTEVYRKPQNQYMYLDRDSAHPPGTWPGIIGSEVFRLWRLHDDPRALDNALAFFVDRLAKRGWTRAEANKLVMHRLQQIRSPTRGTQKKVRTFRLKGTWSARNPFDSVLRLCRRFQPLLKHSITTPFQFGLSWKVQKSRFRRRYASTWR